jgi:hypothetical protein
LVLASWFLFLALRATIGTALALESIDQAAVNADLLAEALSGEEAATGE